MRQHPRSLSRRPASREPAAPGRRGALGTLVKVAMDEFQRGGGRPAVVRELAGADEQPVRAARGAAGGLGVSDRRAVRPGAAGGALQRSRALELLRGERAV